MPRRKHILQFSKCCLAMLLFDQDGTSLVFHIFFSRYCRSCLLREPHVQFGASIGNHRTKDVKNESQLFILLDLTVPERKSAAQS